MVTDVIEDQGLGLLDQKAKHTTSQRGMTELRPQAVLDSSGQELFEAGPPAVQHTECRITGPGQFTGSFEGIVDYRFRVGFDHKIAADFDQPA